MTARVKKAFTIFVVIFAIIFALSAKSIAVDMTIIEIQLYRASGLCYERISLNGIPYNIQCAFYVDGKLVTFVNDPRVEDNKIIIAYPTPSSGALTMSMKLIYNKTIAGGRDSIFDTYVTIYLLVESKKAIPIATNIVTITKGETNKLVGSPTKGSLRQILSADI